MNVRELVEARKVRHVGHPLDAIKPPEGMVYELFPVSVKDDPTPAARWQAAIEAGWRPVPADRHPDWPGEKMGFRLIEIDAASHAAIVAKLLDAPGARGVTDTDMALLIGQLHAPPGFMATTQDLPMTLTKHGWMPTDMARALAGDGYEEGWP